MRKALLVFSFLILSFTFSSVAVAQEIPTSPTLQDSIFEEDAQHNLNVAYQYFKLKKAYRAVLMRFEETFAAYPQFSKMDEFIYIAGMSSFYLSDNKGKQKIDLTKLTEEDQKKYAPKRLKENAVAYFGMIVEQHPNSKYKDDSEKMLKRLKVAK